MLDAENRCNFSSLIDNDTVISNPVDIADKFAQVGCTVVSDDNFDTNTVLRKHTYMNEFQEYICHQNIFLSEEISCVELGQALRKIKGTTPSMGRITYAMIKNSPESLQFRIIKLYNTILENEIYPHDWKVALLSPKPGKNSNRTEGYRLISLIPVLSKLLEKIIARRFWQHTKSKISYPNMVSIQ